MLPPDSLDVDAAYQDFCNTIKKAAKKTIPRGYRNTYIPCWDPECESLYKTFLQSPQEDDSIIYLFISFLLTINLKLIIVHVEIKIVNKEAATKRSTLLHAQRQLCMVAVPLNKAM